MRILITMPWGHRLGGAEAMLQTVLDGAQASGHELELVFFGAGPWPAELREAGFHIEVLEAGRLRDLHRWGATVARVARIFRRRQPDLILNWSAKTQLYGAPAAVLAGMSDRVVWWQHAIQARHWIDRCATALPAIAIGCSSETVARAQALLSPSRPTFVVAPGTRPPGGDSCADNRASACNGGGPAFHGMHALQAVPRPRSTSPRTCRLWASSGGWSHGRARIECSAPRRCCASGGTASTR